MTLSENPRLRLLTLCALYVAQGIPFGFVVVTLKVILAGRGLGTGEIGGVLAMASLPWAFKWLWGPVLDRVDILAMGRRRPWILLAQAFMVGTIGAMIAVGDLVAGVAVLSGLVFVHNIFNSLQDVAVDALAVDLLEERERGRANGLMYGAKYLGTVIGGAGLSWVVGVTDLQTALIVQVAVLGGIFLLPLCLRERPEDSYFGWRRALPSVAPPAPIRVALAPLAAADRLLGELFGDLFKAFSLRSTLLGIGLALAAQLGTGVLSTIGAVLYTQRLGFEPSTLGQLEGSAYLVGLFGAVIGGFLADRFGAKRMIAFGMLGLAGLWVGFAALEPWWHHKSIAVVLLYAEPAFSSLASVGMFSLFMGISWPKVAATQFTAYMALLNLSATVGQGIAGTLDARFDYGGLYLVGALMQVVAVFVLWRIDPGQTRRVLGDGLPARIRPAAQRPTA